MDVRFSVLGRILLIVTMRDAEPVSAPLHACLAALARQSVTRVPLSGLAQPQVRELGATFQDGALDEDLAQVVAERTDGNPFF